jgi:hypothetical protein
VFLTVRHDAPPAQAVILVGHSLFFRELVKLHLPLYPSPRPSGSSGRGKGSDDKDGEAAKAVACEAAALAAAGGDPALLESLRTKKLDNAACLCLDLEWPSGADPMAPPSIAKAALFLGSGFHEKKHDARHDAKLAPAAEAAPETEGAAALK